MALNLGQDLAVIGNIKLTDVELVAGAYRTLPSSSATASLTDQRLEDGQLFYIQSEHRLLKLHKYTDDSFNTVKEYTDFSWPSASYAVTASYALNGAGGGGGGGGSFTAAGISGSLGTNAATIRTLTKAGISGSFTVASASIASDIKEFIDGTATLVSGSSTSTGSFGLLLGDGSQLVNLPASFTPQMISGSLGTNADLIRSLTAASISGSLGTNATLIRGLTAASISGSFTAASASIATRIGSAYADIDALQAQVNQDVRTSATPIFGGMVSTGNVTIQGNLIAQQYIVSSSVTHMTQSFSSGSTIFGDSPNDTHQFTGSILVGSGSVSGSNQSTASFGVYLNISASVAAAGFGSGGGDLSDIVEDTTPQLGGDLDLNSNDIVGNMIVRANSAADLLSVFDSSNNIVFKVNNNKTLKLSAVTGSQPTSEPGGMMYSGSQWYLGTE